MKVGSRKADRPKVARKSELEKVKLSRKPVWLGKEHYGGWVAEAKESK